MANVDNFVFYKAWREKLMKISDIDKRNEFAWKIIEYGTSGDFQPFEDDEFANAWLEEITEAISRQKNQYAQKVEQGKNFGRKQMFDREQLKILIASGKSGLEIADTLGVSKDAIYQDQVWKDRKLYNNYK